MKKIKCKTKIDVNKSLEGEPIETKIERIISNKEPKTDGAPLIFTERDEGVLPSYDIRTDRFEVAIEAMDKVSKTALAKREEAIKVAKEKAIEPPIAQG